MHRSDPTQATAESLPGGIGVLQMRGLDPFRRAEATNEATNMYQDGSMDPNQLGHPEVGAVIRPVLS